MSKPYNPQAPNLYIDEDQIWALRKVSVKLFQLEDPVVHGQTKPVYSTGVHKW